MTTRSRDDRRVIDAFERWLGADLFDRNSTTDYLTAFDDIAAASVGRLPATADRVTLAWGAFEAYLDGFATHALRSVLPGRARRRIPRGRPAASDPPGFVSSEMTAAVSINTASVDELCEVAGIGARLAYGIVETRERRGPFTRLGQLARVPGFMRECYELAAPHLTARSGQTPIAYPELENLSCIGFPACVRFLHNKNLLLPGRASSAGSLPVAALAVREMKLAAAAARSAPYWQKHRSADATRLDLHLQDLEYAHSWVRVDDPKAACRVAPVTNSHYLVITRSLIDHATKSIRISMHMMRLGSEKLSTNILEPLIEAAVRQVDVRILLDTDQGTPDEADQAALTRLQKSGVLVRWSEGEIMMHRKALICDDEFLLVGSHNLTPNSIFRSEELSLFVQNRDLAGSESQYFDDLWG